MNHTLPSNRFTADLRIGRVGAAAVLAIVVGLAAGCSQDDSNDSGSPTESVSSTLAPLVGSPPPTASPSGSTASPTTATVPLFGTTSTPGATTSTVPPTSESTAAPQATVAMDVEPPTSSAAEATPGEATTVAPAIPIAGDIRIIVGSADVAAMIRQRTPLLIDSSPVAPPNDVTVGITAEGSGQPVAAAGSAMLVSFQMYAWATGEAYDGTVPGEPRSIVIGDGQLMPAIETALVGTSPGTELLVAIPVGVAGLPDFVPDDTAYYAVVTVEAVG